MKNKKSISKILILFLILISLSGCTKALKGENNKTIVNQETGQSVTENILCKPTDETTLKLYEENKVDLTTLSDCNSMEAWGEYEGLWTNIFVRPLSFLIINLGKIVNYNAIAIIIITLIIRLLLYPVTKKTAMQSELIKEAQPEISRIEKKYENKTDQESITKKNQETMMVYQKYKINPVFGCLFSLIQLPLLFAFLEAINRTPAIFEETFLGLNMGKTTWIAITQGEYFYIIITLLIIASTYFSFKMNSTAATATKEQEKQQKMMTIFMVVLISFTSFSLPTAIGIYWIVSSAFTIFQNLITDRRRKNKNGKN